ncbi:hypothetical protein VQL36_11500 [Chengkuizengella sp. SCS-71B]|uniref:hypothetical protein n=1 Tax=Chengkuizengella sp. SCS-71B TaxID=3115290 RepID=UPI0032C24B49
MITLVNNEIIIDLNDEEIIQSIEQTEERLTRFFERTERRVQNLSRSSVDIEFTIEDRFTFIFEHIQSSLLKLEGSSIRPTIELVNNVTGSLEEIEQKATDLSSKTWNVVVDLSGDALKTLQNMKKELASLPKELKIKQVIETEEIFTPSASLDSSRSTSTRGKKQRSSKRRTPSKSIRNSKKNKKRNRNVKGKKSIDFNPIDVMDRAVDFINASPDERIEMIADFALNEIAIPNKKSKRSTKKKNLKSRSSKQLTKPSQKNIPSQSTKKLPTLSSKMKIPSKLKRIASKGSKFLGKASAPLNVAMGIKDLINAKKGERAKVTGDIVGSAAGGLVGAKAGIMIGGAIGSIIPGAGTAIGAAAGGLIGGAVGAIGGSKIGSKIGEFAKTKVGGFFDKGKNLFNKIPKTTRSKLSSIKNSPSSSKKVLGTLAGSIIGIKGMSDKSDSLKSMNSFLGYAATGMEEVFKNLENKDLQKNPNTKSKWTKFKRFSKGLGILSTGITAGIGIKEVMETPKNERPKKIGQVVGNISGGVIGTIGGGALSAIPGAGPVLGPIGAVAGYHFGGLLGEKAGGWIGEKIGNIDTKHVMSQINKMKNTATEKTTEMVSNLVSNFKELPNAFDEHWSGMKETVTNNINKIDETIGKHWSKLQAQTDTIWNEIKGSISNHVREAYHSVSYWMNQIDALMKSTPQSNVNIPNTNTNNVIPFPTTPTIPKQRAKYPLTPNLSPFINENNVLPFSHDPKQNPYLNIQSVNASLEKDNVNVYQEKGLNIEINVESFTMKQSSEINYDEIAQEAGQRFAIEIKKVIENTA